MEAELDSDSLLGSIEEEGSALEGVGSLEKAELDSGSLLGSLEEDSALEGTLSLETLPEEIVSLEEAEETEELAMVQEGSANADSNSKRRL